MNNQNFPSPFTAVYEAKPNATTFKTDNLSDMKAAPERGKVSAATDKPTKKPRVRKPKTAQRAMPTFTADEIATIENLRKLSEGRRAAAQNLIADFAEKTAGLDDMTPAPEPAKQAEHPTEETPAVTLDPDPEPRPAQTEWEKREAFEEAYSYKDGYHMPDDANTETIYDKPYRNVVRHGHIHKAWGVWGRLIATHQVPLPDMRDDRWSDNLQCTLDVIAESLAEFDY